jgi:hypothetical protein
MSFHKRTEPYTQVIQQPSRHQSHQLLHRHVSLIIQYSDLILQPACDKSNYLCSRLRLGMPRWPVLTSLNFIEVFVNIFHVIDEISVIMFNLFCYRWRLVFCYFSRFCAWGQHFRTWTTIWCPLTTRYFVLFFSRYLT